MVKILIVSGVLLYATSQVVVMMAQGNTPEQPYQVLKKVGEVEFRFYPPAIEASVQKQGEYERMMNNGFRELAGYIFGGNETQQKIAMTTPVKMELDSTQEAGRFSFIMPEDFQLGKHPKPNSGNIQFKQTEPTYTASITFGGYATDAKREKYAQMLLNYLKENQITAKSSVKYLYYNPPMQVFHRRNEVLVEVQAPAN